MVLFISDGVLLTTVQANVKHIIDVHSAGTEKVIRFFNFKEFLKFINKQYVFIDVSFLLK